MKTVEVKLPQDSYRIHIGPGLLEQTARKFGATAEKLARTLAGERGFFDWITHDWEKNLILSSLQRVVAMMEATELEAAPILATGPIDEDAGKLALMQETADHA